MHTHHPFDLVRILKQAPRALAPGALAVVLGYQGGVAELVAGKLGGAYQVRVCHSICAERACMHPSSC